MRAFSRLAASGLALSAFLFAGPVLAQNRVDANGLPTTDSTPAEKAQTAGLNNQVLLNNAVADGQARQQAAQNQAAIDAQTAANDAQAAANQAKYDQQKQEYQQQLNQNQAAQQNYQDRTRAYYDLRSRYAAERAAYRRGVWPDRFREWRLRSDERLLGSRVEIINGDRVGTVDSVARAPSGRIEALFVTLDGGKQVWIDEADIRFDVAGRVVMTNLDRGDLRIMADERL